jgi:HEAT repeat protein
MAACLAALAMLLPAMRVAWGASSPVDRERSELLARVGEARYRLAILRPGAGDLNESLRSLYEARELDPTNLRALGYLGLARVEAATRGAAAVSGVDAFASAREPLEELFRLSRGWVDPTTRMLLADVTAALDDALGGARAAPENARVWWRAWKERLAPAEASRPPSGDSLLLVATLRTAPHAWERERAATELAASAPPAHEAAESLALALRADASPWVRAAAAKSLAKLGSHAWRVRLAEALRNDGTVWVRRTCAKALGDRRGRPQDLARSRTALLHALDKDTPRVACAAAVSLASLGGAERELVSALESASSLVRSEVAGALRMKVRDAVVIAKLRPLMDSSRAEVRAAALHALGVGREPLPAEMTERILSLLGDADVRVRRCAAAGLQFRLPSGAHERMRQLLSDRDVIVRLMAARTLFDADAATALPVLKDLADSREPLLTMGGANDSRTVGEVAREILSAQANDLEMNSMTKP